MRIEGTPRSAVPSKRRSAQSTGGGSAVFDVGGEVATSRSASSSAPPTTSGIDTLLALQAVEDPLFSKRKKIKRGQSMLETLEEMKIDLLAGRVSEGRLNRLMALVQQAKENVDPTLDALLEDIELRARVELAKIGIYPGY